MTLAVDTAKPFDDDAGILGSRHRLIFRFAIVNIAAFALLGAAYFQGWIGIVAHSDESYISGGIFVVFLFGWGISVAKAWRINGEINRLEVGQTMPGSWAAIYLREIQGRDASAREILGSSLRMNLANWISVVRHVAVSLVLLGLIGTVIGFIIALAGVDPRMTANAGSVVPMVAQLISGMSVALYATLIGSIHNVWLMTNYHMLNSGAVHLIAAIVARGEADAGS
jgi:hypothetical protein